MTTMTADSLIVGFYCLACMGAGLIFFRLLRIGSRPGGYSVLVCLTGAFLLGQALIANVWLLSALNRLFSPAFILIVLSISALAGVPLLLSYRQPLSRQIRHHVAEARTLSRPFQALAALAGATVILHIYPAYAVHPTIDADGFYLLYAKIISSSERLAPLHCWPLASHMSLLTELHFAALFSLSGMGAAKLFMWPVALSIAVILSSLSGLCGLRTCGRWIALILLFTSTAFIFLISDGKTDLTAAALGLCAFYWLAAAVKPLPVSILILAGLLTGFSIAAKNTYLLCFAPPMILLVMGKLASGPANGTAAIRAGHLTLGITVFVFFSALAILPNIVKNFSFFQEPFAPFYYLSGERKTYLDQVWMTPEITRRILMIYPLSLSFGVYNGQYGNLSPLFIAFLPLITLLKSAGHFFRSHPMLIRSAVFGMAGIALWNIFFPSFHAPRYFLASLLLLIPAGASLAGLMLERPETPKLLKASIFLCLFISIGFILFSQTRLILKGQVGGLDWGAPVQGVEGLHDRAIAKANRIIPAGRRVFVYGGNTVYLRGDLLQGLSTASELERHAALHYSKDRWAYLFDRGFSYVMIRGNPYIRNAETENLFRDDDKPEWLNIRESLNQDGLRLFHISAKDPRHRAAFALKQIHPPAWDIVKTNL